MHRNVCVSAAAGALSALAVLWIGGNLTSHVNAGPRSVEELRLAERARELLETTGELIESIAQSVSPAVVSIEAHHRDRDGRVRSDDYGSGIIYRVRPNDPPLVITNLHVLGECDVDAIEIQLADGRVCEPKRIWRDHDTDLALLELPLNDVPTARLADSDRTHVGQWVLVLGSPFGLSQSTTHGIISAKNRRQVGMPGNVRIKEFLQTDAPINPGNSGGPLVNLSGEVIGINTAIASYTGKNSGVGFSIPSNIVRWVVNEMIVYGKVRRPFLGVTFPNHFDAQRAAEVGLSTAKGAYVQRVHPSSPAHVAGIKPRDVVLAFNGQSIDDENHLINIVAQTEIGANVEVTVWRDGERKKMTTKLSEWNLEKPQSKDN